MSGIARILLARGAAVSGSDAKDSRALLALRALGAEVAVGHDASNLDLLPGCPTALVTTKAVHQADPDNPELLEAAARGVPVLHRSAVLAELMADHRAACVSGSAGKTSTTSMLVVALQACGADPSFMIGGDLLASGSSAHHGHGDVFVAEADESDGSFLAYSPAVAIVTNVEPDHLDHHGTAEAYVAVFDAFAARIERGGCLVVCADDPGSAALGDRAEAAGVRVRRYGRAATGPDDVTVLDYRPEASTGLLELQVGESRQQLRLGVAGEHQALNACAALLAGLDLGAPLPRLLAGLASFTGVRRRFELRGPGRGRAGVRRLRARPDEGRRAAARGAPGAGGAGPAAGGVPAAPVLAHPGLRGPVRGGALARRRGRRARRVRRPRAARARRVRRAHRGRGSTCRPSACTTSRRGPRCPRCSRSSPAPGTW